MLLPIFKNLISISKYIQFTLAIKEGKIRNRVGCPKGNHLISEPQLFWKV